MLEIGKLADSFLIGCWLSLAKVWIESAVLKPETTARSSRFDLVCLCLESDSRLYNFSLTLAVCDAQFLSVGTSPSRRGKVGFNELFC